MDFYMTNCQKGQFCTEALGKLFRLAIVRKGSMIKDSLNERLMGTFLSRPTYDSRKP